MKSTKTIWVNPLPRVSVQGRHKQSYVILGGEGMVQTRPMNKTKEFGAVSEYNFPLNRNNPSRLLTGFEKQITNPYKDFQPSELITKYNLSPLWITSLDRITKQSTIPLQTDLEIKHGVEPSFYTSNIKYHMGNLPMNIGDYGKERTFLQDLKLILYARPNEFSDATPRQELLMHMIPMIPKIARNKNEANSSLHDWFISEENETEVASVKKQEVIEEAIYHLYKLKTEHAAFKSYQLVILLRDKFNKTLGKGELPQKAVRRILSDYVTQKDANQLQNIERFMEYVNMIYDKTEADRFFIKYLIQQALNTNVISYRDHEYIWHSKAGTPDVYRLGNDFNKVTNFFLQEYQQYNKESDISNWYKDLYAEVKAKGINLDG